MNRCYEEERNMLRLLFCCVVLFMYAQAEIQIIAPQFKKECLKEIQITPEEIKIINEHKPVQSKNAKCFLACLGTKQFNFMADGKYNHTHTVERVYHLTKGDLQKSGVLLEVLEACENAVKSSEKCEAASEIFACISKVIASRDE